jgi:poly-gamma-glutamate synthesis protein (capsule biosynthesis protein)
MLAVLMSLLAVAALAVVISASTGATRPSSDAPSTPSTPSSPEAGERVTRPSGGADRPPKGVVTLAFAGDMHFELHLSELLDRPEGALGGITRTLRAADLTMVNLESAITTRGAPDEPDDYSFRTSPRALDVLDRAGVDVIGLANNHSVDYGAVGLADTLRAVRGSPAPVVGIGRDARAAYRPHRVSVRGTDLAFFAANTKRERTSRRWAAGPDSPGIATAVDGRPRQLLRAVRSASRRDDVVVVYLHWGTESESCPGPKQRVLARALAEAGADVVVGSHAHELQGSGWVGDTYVNYGLGNFLWYHNQRSESGVLQVRIVDGAVAGDAFVPARIETYGRPRVLTGPGARAAVADWRSLRGCAGLAPRPAS